MLGNTQNCDDPPLALGDFYRIDRYCVSCNEVCGKMCAITEPTCIYGHEDGRLTCVEHRDKEDELYRYFEKAGCYAK